nr:alpha-1,6-glucosidase domain-containing protein [uncultured Roseateles sp.]
MRIRELRGLVVVLLFCLNLGRAGAHALSACDDEALHQVLRPTQALAAEGIWLGANLLQWPGVRAEAGSRFKLYTSRDGRMHAEPGQRVSGGSGSWALTERAAPLPEVSAQRFKYLRAGVMLSVAATDMKALHRGQLLLVQERADGTVLRATALQAAAALDELYAAAEQVNDLGARPGPGSTRFKLWAPTAQRVSLCRYASGSGRALSMQSMRADPATGVWSLALPGDLSGSYYNFVLEVFVRNVGLVRNRVTDPYSVSLTTDSKRSYVANLDDARLKPAGWDESRAPAKVKAQTDMVIYELHVRDFSISDASVTPAHRGKYLAFTEPGANGMQHLRALSEAGLTDVHLLPVFDIASVPEAACVKPRVPDAGPDSEAQQAAVMAVAAADCFNWGYDPFHYNAPEGSYATDSADGARRIIEFRRMVMGLHAAGLRVGMDMVYNHTAASGQKDTSVLDRIVPGYYQRLNARGEVEQSTCCDNTATEHRMMAKLMSDSVLQWAQAYKIASFRFDLMAHQPRAAMEALQARLDAAMGQHINLIGEGWNFGEVADGARFVQASQLSLNGSGIATFSDRTRDAVRGGGHGVSGEAMLTRQGYINGLVYDPNERVTTPQPRSELLRAADLVRVGLAGSLRGYAMTAQDGSLKTLEQLDYNGQPAGYVSQPGEVVNYVENHDNQTLFDINAYRLPLATSREDRVRVQMLGAAITAFSQGVAYFHAGQDLLRSKSMDGNSYDSGDWFNRLDWSYADNHFGSGAPPKADNGAMYPFILPLLADPAIKPGPAEIAMSRDMFRDLLQIRASSTLWRLRSADEIQARLRFHNTGPEQIPALIVGRLDGEGYAGAGFKSLLYLINVDKRPQRLSIAAEQGRAYELHPVHLRPGAGDPRPAAEARYEAASGSFSVPARSVVVFVEK